MTDDEQATAALELLTGVVRCSECGEVLSDWEIARFTYKVPLCGEHWLDSYREMNHFRSMLLGGWD